MMDVDWDDPEIECTALAKDAVHLISAHLA